MRNSTPVNQGILIVEDASLIPRSWFAVGLSLLLGDRHKAMRRTRRPACISGRLRLVTRWTSTSKLRELRANDSGQMTRRHLTS